MTRWKLFLASVLLLFLVLPASLARAEVLHLEKELFYSLAALTADDRETLGALRAQNSEVYIRDVVREGRSVQIIVDTQPGKTAVIEFTNNEIYSLPNFTPPDLANEIMRRSGAAVVVEDIRRSGTAVDMVISFPNKGAEPPPPPPPPPMPEPAPEPAKPVVANPAPEPEPAKPVVAKPAPEPEPAKPAVAKPAPEPEPARPVVAKPAPVPEPARPVPAKPAPVPEPVKPVPVKPAPVPEPVKPVPVKPAPEPARPVPVQPSEKPPGGSPDTLTVGRISGTPPVIDGRGDDPAWRDARPLVTELAGRRGVFVTGYAVTDGDMLYLLLSWNDPDADTINRPWIWDAAGKTYRQSDTLDDGVSVQFSMGKKPGGEVLNDLWMWRAGREGRGDYATDATLTVSRKPLPNSSYAELEGGGGVWIRQAYDEGKLPYERQLPMEFRGDQLPGYILRQPEGSAGNVRAKGAYANGRWTVEFMRKLDTRHPDDVVFSPGKPVAFQVGILEKDEDNLGRFTGSLTLNWVEGAGRKGR